MALTKRLDFQEGTDGANFTATGNYLGVTGPPVYDGIGPPYGLVMDCTNGDFVIVATDSVDNGSFSVYFEILTVTSGVPRVITFTDSGTAFIGMFRAHTDGKFDIANGSSTRVASSTASWSPGIYRVDGFLGGSGTSRTVTLKVFVENDNTSPVWDTAGAVAVTSATSNPWTRARPGAQGGTTGQIRILDVRFYDTQVFAGPLVTQVIATRATTWATKASATATRATTWRTVARTTATRATTWATKALVTGTRATTWNTRAVVSATRAASWRTAARVTATRAGIWDVLAGVVSSRLTTWRTAARTTATRATTWRVRQAVTVTRGTTWGVEAAQTTVVATRATTWEVAGSVTASRPTSWDTLQTVTTTRGTTWATKAAVESVRPATWRVLSRPTATRNTFWRVSGSVSTARSTTWRVYSSAPDRDLTLTGSVASIRFVSVVEGNRFVGSIEPARFKGEVQWR